MNTKLYIIALSLLIASSYCQLDIDEGYHSRNLLQDGSSTPPESFSYPPPTAVTDRGPLYNRPIPLRPGESLIYAPANVFQVRGVAPELEGPVVDVLDGRTPYSRIAPDAQDVLEAIGPALSTVPAESRQSLVNLLTPDIKMVPEVSSAATQLGLQLSPEPPPPGVPGGPGTPTGPNPPSPPGGASSRTTLQLFVVVAVLLATTLLVLF